MSPTSRRGRAVSASQHKSPARSASAASRKPAPAVEETDDQLDDLDPKAKAKVGAAKAAPVRRRRRLSRIKKSSGYRYLNELFGAYLPLFLVFIVVLGGYWGWTVFGPHAPSPQQDWTAAENNWLQKRETDRQKTISDVADFKTQQADYKAFEADTKGWMDELRKVSKDGWDGPNPSAGASQALNSDLVTAFLTAGDSEVLTLDSIATAKSPDDAVVVGDSLITEEQDFNTAYASARSQIMGVQASASGKPMLVLPSVCPGVNPAASASSSDSPSPTVSPSPSPSPTVSPSPSASPSKPSSSNPLAGSSLSVSPSSSPGSAAPSLDACASAAASASAAAAASASPTPTPTATPGLSGSPSPSISAKP